MLPDTVCTKGACAYALRTWAGEHGAYGDLRAMAELANLAEVSGWDGIFLEDYIFHWAGQETYDPWIILAAMAMRTERIRIGITVTPLSRRPWKLAREAVTLDHLSNGRIIVGVGSGNGADQILPV